MPTPAFMRLPDPVSEPTVAVRRAEELIAVVSHELRTPLTSIRGSLGLLAGGVVGPLPDEAMRMVAVALSNTERLTRLVDDILDLERLTSGRMPLDSVAVDAATVVREVADQSLGLARSVSVALDVDTSPVVVRADPHRLAQALTNLVGNAIKFSDSGGRVGLVAAPRGRLARLVVLDNGRGIPPDRLDDIFDPFAQVESADASSMGGTGLGLPIAQRIVEAHGGRLLVSSVPGQGSTFTIELPLDGVRDAGRDAAVRR